MFTIYKQVKSDLYDFTDVCSEIQLRSNQSEISEHLSFKVKGTQISEGDIIVLRKDSSDIFLGVVESVDKDKNTKTVNCFDFGWYLNKNEEVYQFNCTVSEAIHKICDDFQIRKGKIADINVKVKKVFTGVLSDIIRQLLELATSNNSIEYISYMSQNGFNVELRSKTVVYYNTKMFGSEINITELIANANLSRSISELKNAIKVVNQEENNVSVLAYEEDSESIKRFGLLQKIESLSNEEKNNAKNIATTNLKKLNKVSVLSNLELPGIIECRANKILEFHDEVIGIHGFYIVKICEHTITSSSHLMKLELELEE